MVKIFFKKYSFIFVVFLLFLASCSMQKRVYTKGFYAHKNQSTKRYETIVKADTLPKLKIENLPLKHKNTQLTASITESNESFILKHILIEGCDTIVLKNGAKVLAVITEVNLTKILFKNCNSTDETILFLKKSDVSYINFANGSKQVFDIESNNNMPQNLPGERNNTQQINPKGSGRSNSYTQPSKEKLNTFSLISFLISVVPYPFIIILFALLGLASILPGGNSNAFSQVFGVPHMSAALLVPGVFVVAALVLSILAIYQIKNNGSDNKKGLKLAYIALILSLVLLLLLLLFAF